MLVSVVFFLFISLAIIAGLVGPTVREFKNANSNLNSKKSYFLAESGGEDAFYRIKNNMAIGSSEIITLGSNSSTTTITSPSSSSRQIVSLGDLGGLQRKTKLSLQVGAGTSFNYGVQVGNGGLILQNSSSVVGNVYSNGPVVGTARISSNPNNPQFISSVNIGPTAYRAVLGGSYVYVVNESTVQTVNISNPASPSVVSTVTNGGQQKDITLGNEYIFVTATNDNVVRAFSLSNPGTPSYVGSVAVTGANQIKAYGSYVYVLSNVGSHTLKTINVSNPSAMAVVSSVNTSSTFPVGMAIQGTYLYVISQGGPSKLEIYSIANPASPTLVSATTIGVNPITIAVAGSYAYIDVYACGCIQVFNISNPTAPVIVDNTSVNSLNNGYSLYVAGSYLYAAVNYGTNHQFQIWDISNPTAMVNIQTINISGGAPVFVMGGQAGYIYLLTQNNNANSPLRIYQVTASRGNTVTGDVVSAGATGSINQIHATNSLYARTISNSLADKDAYYKNISNTAILGLSYPNSSDQPTISMPISDDKITQWETDAVAGGIINFPCPYIISRSSSVTLGPVKIDCDLELRNSSSLTLAGNVWVNGSVTLRNSGTIQVDSSISGKTVGLIADDPTNRTTSSKINISNSTSFVGSGTNSYVMLISQNNSAEMGGSEVAIDSSNSMTGKVLLYAPHGEISISNSASIKEVTGWKILLQNTAQVIYETGLANLLFTSGPAGGYVFDGWSESE